MKKVFKRGLLILLVVAMAVSTAACAGGGGSSSAAPASSAAPGSSAATETPAGPAANEIVIGRPQDSDDLDPVLQDGNVNIWVFNLCLEPLVQVSDDGKEIEPLLAESWDISDDNKTITFHIRPGLKFSDGSDVTKEDIVWSYERAISTEESPWQSLLENIDSVEAPDDTTFIVHMKEASPYSMSLFTLFNLVITSKAHFDQVGEEGYTKGPLGTGGYKFSEWVVGEYMILEKNENFREADKVTTDRIRFNVIADDNTRIMQLQSGDIDIMTFVPWNRMAELDADPNLQTLTPLATEVRELALNCTKEPTSDVRVRKAIQMSLDLDAIAKTVLYGYGTPGQSFINPSDTFHNPNVKRPTGSVDEAKALLAEAGYPDGVELQLMVPTGNTVYESIATMAKEQLAAAGIKIDIQLLEVGTLNAKRNALELDMFLGGWTDDVPDPFQRVNYWCDPSMVNCLHTGWVNEEVVTKLNQAKVEMDENARRELYNSIQEIYMDEVPTIPLYYTPYPVAMSKDITGFVQTPLGNYRFNDLHKVA